MSNLCLSAVLEHSQSKGVARLVLLIIADIANDEGEAWPGSELIAKKANIERQNVPRAIRELVKLGELTVITRGGPRYANLYRLSDSLMAHPSQQQAVSPASSPALTVSAGLSHDEAQTLNEPSGTLKEEGFLQKLKTNAAYAGIDVEREALRAREWLQRRAGQRPFDEGFLRRWLDRARPVRRAQTGAVLTGAWQGGAVL